MDPQLSAAIDAVMNDLKAMSPEEFKAKLQQSAGGEISRVFSETQDFFDAMTPEQSFSLMLKHRACLPSENMGPIVWPESLSDGNLTMVRLHPDHAADLLQTWGCDPRVFETLSSAAVDTAEAMNTLISISTSRWDDGTQFRYALLKNSQPIGLFTLTYYPHLCGMVEMGMSVASAFWRQGVSKSAMSLVAAYASVHAQECLCWASVRQENTKSANALEGAGFDCFGLIPRHKVYGEACREPHVLSHVFFASPAMITQALTASTAQSGE